MLILHHIVCSTMAPMDTTLGVAVGMGVGNPCGPSVRQSGIPISSHRTAAIGLMLIVHQGTK